MGAWIVIATMTMMTLMSATTGARVSCRISGVEMSCAGGKLTEVAMRKIMRACNFSSVDYDSQATSTDVTVSASPYTDVAQLTSATTSTNARETNSDGDDNSSSDDRNSNEMDRDSDNQDDGDDDDNAAGKAAMPGMAALVGLVAAGALM